MIQKLLFPETLSKGLHSSNQSTEDRFDPTKTKMTVKSLVESYKVSEAKQFEQENR